MASAGMTISNGGRVIGGIGASAVNHVVRFAQSLFNAAKGENDLIRKISEEPDSISVPFAYVSSAPSRSASRCQMAVGIRGTMTYMEWSLDFQTWLYPDPIIPGLRSHKGVMSIALSLISSVRHALQEASRASDCVCEETKIYVTGHSLGASVALNVAAYLQNFFRDCATVHAVLFAPLKHIDARSRHVVQNAVNLRTIMDISDPLFHLPCSGIPFPRCNHGAGYDLFDDHDQLVLINVPYKATPNPVTTEPSVLQVLHDTFVPPQVVDRLPAPDSIISAHSCAHSCALSSACQAFGWGCTTCPNR
ncbi:lipase [Gregarina niphandrodes]|uniref:Lipase n=1 Tax=Gregarina niphandrodes TaxID=110365 RepID=A0A023BBE2_GRENI|nr:lipase [Gregarina niphandrodes]EZG79581.1 lipase [Gregarina niphandrodes]|eukprot:XP_011134413.1 lipase [Gregarina niphandrodes]